MTARNEARAKCIGAMEQMIDRSRPFETSCDAATAVFDALHGIARVSPIEATEEMIEASYEKERNLFGPTACGLKHSVIFETMSAVGDLTNGPEKKQ